MDTFEEYLRQGEPDKAERAEIWKTAIGLQQVDGLSTSVYLIETARQNIEGYISIGEVKQLIDDYYKQYPSIHEDNRTEEADKVSARITEILSEKTFNFSPAEYLAIHRRLFLGIYPHAGKIRDYNITKQEWVLNGETVLYGSAVSLKAALEYDFQQEKIFSYAGLGRQEVVEHIAHFISYLWQIHVFGEGNTRTTAIFLIKYLRKLGFREVNNNLFANHSWFFRNALVRANYEDLSAGIHKTDKYLVRFLLNLIHQENHLLKNRELHIRYKAPADDTVNSADDTVNDTVKSAYNTVLGLIVQDGTITAAEISNRLHISLSTAKRKLKELRDKGIVKREGSDKTGYWKVIR
jgi:fido (protein-threonine AMPylation protein)